MTVSSEDPRPEISSGVENRVAVVTLNRPEVLNALSFEMRVDLVERLRALDRDPEVRVIVVTGAGRGFCAGADTAALAGAADRPAHQRSTLDNLPTAVLELGTPVVAAVNGPAAGIGFALMLCADVSFVAEDAKLVTSFARLGLIAEHGTAWLLPRVVGMSRAVEILLSGRTLRGDEAARIGLAVEAMPAGEVLTRALAWANDVADNCSPWALRQMKRQLYADTTLPMETAVHRSLAPMAESLRRPDVAEALAARREHRSPRFAAG
ncbi:enoyl-CoA hydratase-related protein [Pseudonocardia ailaonensis]|uniref:Enoyl-CoA hydratase-related protein n=1 Tax=Pseudonocardia ailaonensis TaxID=367279 RepID=A0ABN2N2H9_9PSEU